MSIRIEKQTPFGPITATYWKILQTNVNWHNHKALVQLGGFINEAARRSDAQAIAVVQFEWDGNRAFFHLGNNQVVFNSPFPFSVDQPVLSAAYDAIKKLETWQHAEDV